MLRRISQARSILAVAAVTGLFLATGAMQSPNWLGNQPAFAQRVRPDGIWQVIYEKLPDLPLENQYISRETRQVASDNTLVGRLIRYHIYVKGRPPFYRLDWKFTLADYLGVNGVINESDYPSRDTLRTNPLEGDVAAIRSLNQQQRNALIQALVDAFTPQAQPTPRMPRQSQSQDR
jgi:hypothetical protein